MNDFSRVASMIRGAIAPAYSPCEKEGKWELGDAQFGGTLEFSVASL